MSMNSTKQNIGRHVTRITCAQVEASSGRENRKVRRGARHVEILQAGQVRDPGDKGCIVGVSPVLNLTGAGLLLSLIHI